MMMVIVRPTPLHSTVHATCHGHGHVTVTTTTTTVVATEKQKAAIIIIMSMPPSIPNLLGAKYFLSLSIWLHVI